MKVEYDGVENPLVSILDKIPGTSPAIFTEAASLTYADLKRLIGQMAAFYRDHQLPLKSRVMIMMPDGVAWVVAYLGAIWAGLIPVGVNPRISRLELVEMYRLATPSFIVSDHTCQLLFEQGPINRFINNVYFISDNNVLFNDLASYQAAKAQYYKKGDELLWVFTSGSTGQPKVIKHHAEAIYHSIQFAQEILGITSHDKLYSTSRLFFAYPLANVLFAAMGCGASIVLNEDWPSCETLLTIISYHQPTIVFSIPTLYRKLLKQEKIAELMGASVRCFVSAGEHLSTEFEAMWQKKLTVPLLNGYGMSETFSFILYRYMNSLPGMQVVPGVKIYSSDQKPRRLCFSHPALSQRKMQFIEDTPPEIYISDDIFSEILPQRFIFHGRADFLFKIKGRFVHAIEEENYLLTHGADILQDVAVICELDTEGNSRIVWCVVVDDKIASFVAEEKLSQLKEALPSYRRPVRWCYYDVLPRTSTGKLLYRCLKSSAPTEEILQK